MTGIALGTSLLSSHGQRSLNPINVPDVDGYGLCLWARAADGYVRTGAWQVPLIDGDCELPLTANWTAINNATLSKQTVGASTGKQWLKVAYSDTNYPCAEQTCLTTNKIYTISGIVAGDGANAFYLTDTVNVLAVFTASTTWQTFSITIKAAATKLRFVSNATVAGGYLGIDSVSIVENYIVDGDMEATSGTQPNLLDGNMELDGYANWTAFQSILSKSTDSPHSGTKALRLSYDGANAYAMAGQACLTIGQTYRIQGYARGDGTVAPNASNNAGTSIWQGTSSTSWQAIDATWIADATSFWLRCPLLAANRWVEFDDITITNVSAPAYTALQAIASKVAGTRTGGTGSKVLRIQFDGTNSYGLVLQQPLTTGHVYRLRGWARGDGTAYPLVAKEGAAVFTGSTSTAWQEIDVTFTSTGTIIYIEGIGLTGGHYVEYDDITIERLTINDGDMEQNYVTQPTVTNANFEGAAGPAGWGSSQATISRESGTRTGGTGSYVGQVAYDGSHTVGQMYQVCLTIGQTHRVQGWCRSVDGYSIPIVRDSAIYYWTGTESTDWQYFDITVPAQATAIGCFCGNLDVGRAVQFDDITITNVSAPAWTAYQAIVSKSTANPHSGTQCLRVAYSSSTYGYAKQDVVTVGQAYRVKGYARSDGVNTPKMWDIATGAVWTGTTSTDWQAFDFTYVAANAGLACFAYMTSGYVEYDDITIEPLSIYCLVDRSGKAHNIGQTTVTKQPYYKTSAINGKPAIKFDGVDDFIKTAAFTLNQPEHAFIVAKWTAAAGAPYIFDGATTNHCALYNPDTTTASIYAGSGVTKATAITGNPQTFEVLFNGANSKLIVDFGAATTGDAGASNAGGIMLGSVGGATGYFANAEIAEVLVFNRALTETERNRLRRYFRSQYNI